MIVIKDLMQCELGVTVKPSCDIMSPTVHNSSISYIRMSDMSNALITI